MVWATGGGFARFSGVPESMSSSTASARHSLSGRHSQSLHNAVSRSLQSGAAQRAANLVASRAPLVASVTSAAVAGAAAADSRVSTARSNGDLNFLAQLNGDNFFQSQPLLPAYLAPAREQEQLYPDATTLAAFLLAGAAASGFNQANTQANNQQTSSFTSLQQSSHSHISKELHHSPSTQQHSHQPLPQQLAQLVMPSIPVNLPSPGSIPLKGLDNRELDKLVATLGKSASTWRRALSLYDWLKECGHHLDDRLCTTLIRVCADHGQVVSALNVYEWMKAPRSAGGAALTPTVYTYTAAMRAALSANMLDKAMQIWSDCESARCRPDCRLSITFIEVCSKMGHVDKALAMYDSMRCAAPHSKMAPTVHAYTAAMRAATEGGRWQRALDIWQDMKRAGCKPTGHAYAAAISACAAGNDGKLARQLFEEMRSFGIRADVVSCTALITALASSGDADAAESAVQWMLSEGLRPNVRTYTALLNALGAAQRWDRAVEMLTLMQRSEWGSVQPNAYTYSALLKSLGEHGQWLLAESVFGQAERDVLGPSSSCIRALPAAASVSVSSATDSPISTPTSTDTQSGSNTTSSIEAAALNNWTSPAQLNGLDLNLTHGSDCSPRSAFSLFSVQPNGAGGQGRALVATADAGSHLAIHNSTLPPGASEQAHEYHTRHRIETRIINEVVCGALMLAYERASRWEEAMGVLGRARRLGLRPNTVMYNTAISAVGKAGQMHLAESLFREISDADLVTYETMIAAYGMAGLPRRAEAMYHAMLTAGFRPRDYAYCGMVAAYSAVRDLKSAVGVRARAAADGGHMTVHVYNSMLAACERADGIREAAEVLQLMALDGVEMNGVTHQLLTSMRRRHGQGEVEMGALEAAVDAACGAVQSVMSVVQQCGSAVVTTLLRHSDRLRIAGFSCA